MGHEVFQRLIDFALGIAAPEVELFTVGKEASLDNGAAQLVHGRCFVLACLVLLVADDVLHGLGQLGDVALHHILADLHGALEGLVIGRLRQHHHGLAPLGLGHEPEIGLHRRIRRKRQEAQAHAAGEHADCHAVNHLVKGEQKGIIHLCVDTDVTEYGNTTYFFGLNNGAAGDLMGQHSVEWLKENLDQEIAHVIDINGSGLGEVVLTRTSNAVDYLCENMGVDREKTYFLDITDYDLANIKQKVQDYLTLCSDYENIIIYCLSSSWTPAVEAAVKAAGMTDKVYYFSVDGVAATIETLKAAANGTETILKGEVATYPEFYGKTLIEDAQKILAGEDVDTHLYSVNGWMTKDNIYELYPD